MRNLAVPINDPYLLGENDNKNKNQFHVFRIQIYREKQHIDQCNLLKLKIELLYSLQKEKSNYF